MIIGTILGDASWGAHVVGVLRIRALKLGV